MKILLDTCVWGGALQALRLGGHDVEWTGALEQDPGDIEILALAHAEGRVLVTLDKDFGELAVVHGHPHSGIVRIVGFSARDQAQVIAHVVERYEADLQHGALVTVEHGRIRVRPRSSE